MDNPPGRSATRQGQSRRRRWRPTRWRSRRAAGCRASPAPARPPQVFETIEDLERAGRLEPPRAAPKPLGAPPARRRPAAWLAGRAPRTWRSATRIVIVGASASMTIAGSERWDVRKLTARRGRTPPTAPRSPSTDAAGLRSTRPALAAEAGHRIFAFRDRASLFGYNAPHPNVLGDGDSRPSTAMRRRPTTGSSNRATQPGRSSTASRTAGSPARSSC